MTNPNRPSVFIEKLMPVKLLNQQVYYEHGGNPFKGLHRWYSRKPLSFSRASVLASILPSDITMEEFLYIMGLYGQDDWEFWEQSKKTEEEKDKLRNNKEVRLYKQPPSEKQIQRLYQQCQRIWGNNNEDDRQDINKDNRQDACPTDDCPTHNDHNRQDACSTVTILDQLQKDIDKW